MFLSQNPLIPTLARRGHVERPPERVLNKCDSRSSRPNKLSNGTCATKNASAARTDSQNAFPTWCEILEILKSLGYHKPD